MLTQDKIPGPVSDLSECEEEGRETGQSKGVGPEALAYKRKPLFFPLIGLK